MFHCVFAGYTFSFYFINDNKMKRTEKENFHQREKIVCGTCSECVCECKGGITCVRGHKIKDYVFLPFRKKLFFVFGEFENEYRKPKEEKTWVFLSKKCRNSWMDLKGRLITDIFRLCEYANSSILAISTISTWRNIVSLQIQSKIYRRVNSARKLHRFTPTIGV